MLIMPPEGDVRRIALSLPQTTEEPWYGSPGYKVAGRGFLRLRTEADGGLVVFVADLGEKEALLTSDQEAFYTTPHYNNYPIVLINLAKVDPTELEELIIESWRLKAPVKVRTAYDRKW
jgi:hypothetical protein